MKHAVYKCTVVAILLTLPAFTLATAISDDTRFSDPVMSDAVDACDRLAADPHDPEARAVGIDDAQLLLQLEPALFACQRAVDRVPGHRAHARLFYQLGRTLAASGKQGASLVQFQQAAAMSHVGAITQLIDQALQNGVSDEQSLYEFAHQLADAVALGYQPAEALYDRVVDRLSVDEQSVPDFNASLFHNSVVLQAAYERDFDTLDQWSTDELLIDHIGIQGSLLLYVAGFEESISQVWICPTLSSPALAAAAQRAETEGMLDKLLKQPSTVIKDGSAAFGEIVKPKNDRDKGFRNLVRRLGQALTRNHESAEHLKSQGRKDAMLLSQHYGCDSAISLAIARHLSEYFAKVERAHDMSSHDQSAVVAR